MRIAHLMPFPAIGGTEVGQLRVMQAAQKHGFESIVIHLEEAPIVGEYYRKHGFEAEHFPAPQPSLRHGLRYLRDSKKLAGVLKSRGVSLLHCADILAGYHGGLAGRLAGIPVLSHVRGRYAQLSRKEQLVLRGVQYWAFVSSSTARAFCVPVSPQRSRVLYDGIPLPETRDTSVVKEVRAEFGFAPDAKIVGMFARVAPGKDYESLAQAAKLLRTAHPELRFLIVGDYDSTPFLRDYYAEVKASVREHGVEDLFVFTGFRPDVSRLMDSIDIFVLATHSEGLPLVVLEAMSQWRPVVATGIDGIPEIVRDGETGILVPDRDVPALAAALDRILSDTEYAAKLGQTGRRRVEQEFSQTAFEDRVARIYREILQSESRL